MRGQDGRGERTGGVAVYVAAQLLPLAVFLVGAKLHKLALLGADVGPWGAGRLLAPDLAVVAGLWVVGVLALRRARGPGRSAAAAGLLLVTLALTVAALLEHGFFVATGSYLDGNLVVYGATHLTDLRPVLLHGMPPFVLGALAGVVALVSLPAALALVPAVRRRAQTLRLRWAAVAVGGALAVAAVAGVAAPAVADHVMPLRASALVTLGVTLAGEAARAAARPTDLPAATPELRVEGPTEAPRNVVLIVLESTRASATSLYPPFRDTTPRLAELAARGALVEEAYTVVPHTTKALVAIHCGIPPTIDTWNVEAEPGGIPHDCFPTVLRRNGWATALFQSVDESYEKGARFARRFGYSTFRGPEHLPTDGFDRSSYFGYEDDVLLAPALGWVDRQAGPFLLTLLTVTPHHDYRVPQGFPRRPYADDPELDGYLNDVRYVDRFVGKVVDGLEARGLLDRTLVVVLADHGEGFGEHERRQHDNVVWEEGLRIPMVLAGAGITPGTRVRGLRQSIDVMPTVLDVLGFRVVEGELAGRSLLAPQGHDVLRHACHYHTQCMAERRGHDKRIWHFDLRPAERFDLDADPWERAPAPVDDPAALGAALLGWKHDVAALYGDPAATLRARSVAPLERGRDAGVDLGGGVALVSLSIDPEALEPGAEAEVSAELAVIAAPGGAFSLGLRLRDPSGAWHDGDHPAVWGAWPVPRWQAGTRVTDRSWVAIPDAGPTGSWEVWLGLREHSPDGTVQWRGPSRPVGHVDVTSAPERAEDR